MRFYSIILKRYIEIPDKKVRYIKKSGKKFAVGSYNINGDRKEAWKIIG